MELDQVTFKLTPNFRGFKSMKSISTARKEYNISLSTLASKIQL